ncbi:MAG: PaaI family thioesterase [Actinomycetota bacterium]
MNLDVDRYCFVCGPDNAHGLHVRFERGDGKASARFVPAPEHQGYTGVSHGGIIAALLDEAMVYAAVSLGNWAATAEMTVRFLRPVPTSEELVVTAEVTRHQRRLVECRGEIRGGDGTVLATGTAKLMQGKRITDDERDALPKP